MRLTEELLLKRYKGAYGVDRVTKLNESNLLWFLNTVRFERQKHAERELPGGASTTVARRWMLSSENRTYYSRY